MTKSSILILTLTGDTHAYAVTEALRRKGATVDLWHTSDFPSMETEHIEFSQDRLEIGIQGPGLSWTGSEPRSIWNRRKLFVMEENDLHEADLKFASNECYLFREAFLHLLSQQAFWVNPWLEAQLAENKPNQLRLAKEVGLPIPETLFTNDPVRIRRFLADHGGRILYKCLMTRAWTDGQKLWMPYASVVEERDLPADRALRGAPGIYQELVEKDHELRVNVIGKKIFSAKILSQETTTGKLDWRKSYAELTIEPHELDSTVARACLEMMDRLGLVFGCFDFIVTPEGEHVFLEVNQMGQFLFVEIYSGLPLVDAFSELLLQGRADYAWDPDQTKIAYDDEMRAAVRSKVAEVKDKHVGLPQRLWQE